MLAPEQQQELEHLRLELTKTRDANEDNFETIRKSDIVFNTTPPVNRGVDHRVYPDSPSSRASSDHDSITQSMYNLSIVPSMSTALQNEIKLNILRCDLEFDDKGREQSRFVICVESLSGYGLWYVKKSENQISKLDEKVRFACIFHF